MFGITRKSGAGPARFFQVGRNSGNYFDGFADRLSRGVVRRSPKVEIREKNRHGPIGAVRDLKRCIRVGRTMGIFQSKARRIVEGEPKVYIR